MSVHSVLHRVQSAPRLTIALRDARDLVSAAMRSTRPEADARLLATAIETGDPVTAIAAIHAIAALAHPNGDHVLADHLVGPDPSLVSHAGMGARGEGPDAARDPGLLRLAEAGGFTGMLAERTSVEWSRGVPSGVPLPMLPLTRFTIADRAHLSRPAAGDGVVVVQPFLHARLDDVGSSLGAGDAGGIASLLRSLGTSLAQQQEVDEVITITRAEQRDGIDVVPLSGTLGDGHRIERIQYGTAQTVPWREAWPYRRHIEEEMLKIGRALGSRRVVWHLRMADVGTLAAAAVARRLGQSVVFTAAADPHVVLDALEADGRLDRSSFAAEDLKWQYWFRGRMVERLCEQVDHLALLPRPGLRRDLIDLIGLTASSLDDHSDVVPEGVDVAAIDAAIERRSTRTGKCHAVERILSQLPSERRHLPWLVTVGRLHPLKGPHRIVAAVAERPELASQFNLVLIGGDLAAPSADERATLDLIEQAAQTLQPGVLSLSGHQPPTEIADLLVHAAENGGIYVCASDKEEFGLAIVEALAAGLAVVAPRRGGPQTYVDHGTNGVLCDTTSTRELADAIVLAATLVDDDERMAAARAMTRAELSVDTMAERLAAVYAEVSRPAVVAA